MDYKIHSYIVSNGTASTAAADTEYGTMRVGHSCLTELNNTLLPLSIKANDWTEAKTKLEALVEKHWQDAYGENGTVAGADSERKDKDGKWEPKDANTWYAHPLVQMEKEANLAYSVHMPDTSDYHVINAFIQKDGH